MPSVREFYEVNRGGGLFSEAVSQRLGAVTAYAASRLGLRPTTLTLANLAIGLTVSTLVVAFSASCPLWMRLLALVGWQVAYVLDCSDGQLARVTGQRSAAGARIDILCDVASQIALVTAISAVAFSRSDAPVWLLTAFAGTWMVNLVTSVLQSGPNADSMVPSRSLPVRVIKLVRDPGAVFLLAGLVLAIEPDWAVWFALAFAIVNGGFLLASIAFTARKAYQPS
ncbi:MAG: CDP-alcohol phosphatidyltransferase family protein [Hamadaea sp.]|uniref:CDP-alcohol phosphatidyltransferase family protein n=1 Tax=Hamadaea sp. TaxID=2024425 RepID=UPI0017BD3E65|nr:CDP-alcohol phosphatidyltransferase family protein [Hamadaea sp.]NUR73962.1 CDP-alcohol phosphatidyltransferase family protein [Hamadaea sp.]NUT24177.1 CDP-alcohol phosphatidyltransferase family protein [Hamadaea sp.]